MTLNKPRYFLQWKCIAATFQKLDKNKLIFSLSVRIFISSIVILFFVVIYSCYVHVTWCCFIENSKLQTPSSLWTTKKIQWRLNVFMYYYVHTEVFRQRVCLTIVTSWQFGDVMITRHKGPSPKLASCNKMKILQRETKCVLLS